MMPVDVDDHAATTTDEAYQGQSIDGTTVLQEATREGLKAQLFIEALRIVNDQIRGQQVRGPG